MQDSEVIKIAQMHLKTERIPRSATSTAMGDQTCWQVSFAGDDQEPIIVTIADGSGEVLQVFEPLKMMPGVMSDIITDIPKS